MTVVLLIAAAGWIVAALVVGLYLGERGRRRDAQRREGVIPVDRLKRAVVRRAKAPDAPALTSELHEARDRYVAEAVAEGHSPEDAAADFDDMIATAGTDQIAAFKG